MTDAKGRFNPRARLCGEWCMIQGTHDWRRNRKMLRMNTASTACSMLFWRIPCSASFAAAPSTRRVLYTDAACRRTVAALDDVLINARTKRNPKIVSGPTTANCPNASRPWA